MQAFPERSQPELKGFTPQPSCPTLTLAERRMLVAYMNSTPEQRRATLLWNERQHKAGFGVSDSLLHAMKWLFTV